MGYYIGIPLLLIVIGGIIYWRLSRKKDVPPPKIRFNYDKYSDVLYVSIGKRIPAVGEIMKHGIVVRRTIIDGKLVGYTLIDFARNFNQRKILNYCRNVVCMPEAVIHKATRFLASM